MRLRGLMIGLIWGWLVLPALGQEPSTSGAEAKQETSRSLPKIGAEAQAGLRLAKGEAAKAKGRVGADRQQALASAAKAYLAVVSRFPADVAACAAAHFQAGELWRRHGSGEGSRTCAYAEATSNRSSPWWKARREMTRSTFPPPAAGCDTGRPGRSHALSPAPEDLARFVRAHGLALRSLRWRRSRASERLRRLRSLG